MIDPDAESLPEKAGVRAWIGLAVLAMPALLVSIDVSVMILALPHIGTDLGASNTEQLWIMDIYGFMLSGLLITMGTLGDRIGRRKLLMIGAFAFGLASIAAAFAQSPEWLITARAILGIAGATVAPSTLALISNMCRNPKQRSLAYGMWMACSVGGMALGPVVGGVLLEWFWWGSVFLIGVPAMAVLLVTAPVLLPEYKADKVGKIDMASVALSLISTVLMIYGFKEIAVSGIDIVRSGFVLAGVASGVLFLRRQVRLKDPLIDLTLFRNPKFSSALGGMFGITLTGAIMLFIAQYLQLIQGLSPLQAALWMLPAVLASMVGMLLSPFIARSIRPAHLIGAGLVVSSIGCALVTQADTVTGLLYVVIGYTLFNLGASPLPSLAGDLVVGSAPTEKAGAAAGLLQTSGEFAFALGIACLGSAGAMMYRKKMGGIGSEDVPNTTILSALQDSLAGAVAESSTWSEPLRSQLLGKAYEAYTGGMHFVAGVSACIFIVVAVLIVLKLRHVKPIGQ